MKLDKFTNGRVAQLFDMRASDGWPPRFPKGDKQFMIKQGVCDVDGVLHDHVLAHLLKLETAQLPDPIRNRAYTFLAVTTDGTACYVRDERDRRILFWLMINFPRCMFGI